MKFNIRCEEPKIQVSWNRLENNTGAIVSVYFYTGERYQHTANLIGLDLEGCSFYIENEKGEDVGRFSLIPETEEERNILSSGRGFAAPWYQREKEHEYFLFLLYKEGEKTAKESFQYSRTF